MENTKYGTTDDVENPNQGGSAQSTSPNLKKILIIAGATVGALAVVGIAAGAIAASSSAPSGKSPTMEQQWANYKTTYNKVYVNDAIDHSRFQNFKDNMELAASRNADGALGSHGVTKFFDMSKEEFDGKYKGFMAGGTYQPADATIAKATAPKTIDWRNKGVLTPVKNQGQCGSCWAFSATEQIETDNYFATGVLPVLSPQQIASCDTLQGVQGCNGGYTSSAYDYVVANGIETNKDYPYTSGTTEKTGACDYNANEVDQAVKLSGYTTISDSASGEAAMATQIQTSPMSICLDATAFQTYQSGVLGASCGQTVDHCVQVVGMGNTAADGDYWIVRNSWGTDWGVEGGYVYVKYGINACNIASTATIANIADSAEDQQDRMFNKFVADYNKQYSDEERAKAKTAFIGNLHRATNRNSAHRNVGQHGVTQFMDLTAEEFNAKWKGYKGAENNPPGYAYYTAPTGPAPAATPTAPAPTGPAPAPVPRVTDIDWRTKGVLTPVKNQGQCGSCWAFSATEQIESDYFLKNGVLPVLSPQQITSCDTLDNVEGCSGGFTSSAFDYVAANGIETNKEYPYTSGTTEATGTCDYNKADADLHISGFTSISSSASGEPAMATTILKQPISICVDATEFQTYQEGTILGAGCGQTVDHCVQAVGIGTDPDTPSKQYWIVRNSWADTWGDEGFCYVEYGVNACAIASTANVANI